MQLSVLERSYQACFLGIMHVWQKRVAKTDVQYVIDNEQIPMVEQY